MVKAKIMLATGVLIKYSLMLGNLVPKVRKNIGHVRQLSQRKTNSAACRAAVQINRAADRASVWMAYTV